MYNAVERCAAVVIVTLQHYGSFGAQMVNERVNAYFVHEAKTYRVRAGAKVKRMEQMTDLSRSTIGRIENDAGVSEVNAYAYLNALKSIANEYPHAAPFTRPLKAKVGVVQMRADKL